MPRIQLPSISDWRYLERDGFRLSLCRQIDEYDAPGRLYRVCLLADAGELAPLRAQAEELSLPRGAGGRP